MTIVTLKLAVQSSAALSDHVRSLGLTPKDEFHTTVFYSEEHPLYERSDLAELLEESLPFTVNPSTYAFDCFGGPVLTYGSPEQVGMRETLRALAVQHMISGPETDGEWNILQRAALFRTSSIFDLNPHITLSKDRADFTPKPFMVPLVFDAYIIKQNLAR